ncbi:MAG: hypothetical protein LBF97_07510, partial [Elusimicrobiota bacterium]|nr:hypothetical protein [Elusimicrobiota bacterium]
MTKIRKKFYSFFKYFMYIFLDFFTNIFFHIKNYKIKKSNEILITRIDNLGDFVVSLNILKKIREKIKKNPTFQNVKITFLCNDFLVELAKKTNLFDEIISVDAKKIFFGDNLLEISLNFENLAYRCKKLLKLKQKKYIKIIHLNNKYMTSFLLKNLYADKKIGMFDKIGKKNLNKFINKFYDKYIEIPDKNELKKLTYFFNKMFDGNIVTAPPSINFNINSKKHFI